MCLGADIGAYIADEMTGQTPMGTRQTRPYVMSLDATFSGASMVRGISMLAVTVAD